MPEPCCMCLSVSCHVCVPAPPGVQKFTARPNRLAGRVEGLQGRLRIAPMGSLSVAFSRPRTQHTCPPHYGTGALLSVSCSACKSHASFTAAPEARAARVGRASRTNVADCSRVRRCSPARRSSGDPWPRPPRRAPIRRRQKESAQARTCTLCARSVTLRAPSDG